MKCGYFHLFETVNPFYKKIFRDAGFIFLIVACLSVIVRANNDIQQIDAENARQLIKQAQKLTIRGKISEAEKLLRRGIQIYPQDSSLKLNLAYNLLKQKQIPEAYNLSFEVARIEPDNSYAFAVLGAALLTAGNFKDAQLSFINSLQLDKKQALAWAGLGTLDFYENRIPSALKSLRTAVYLETREPDFLFTLGQISARAENYNEAADAYEKFLQVSTQTDKERRDRIRGLINFLRFLGKKQILYAPDGAQETAVSFNLINDRPVIPLKINKGEESLNFVLDTGAGISVISRETAEKLKIKPITRGGLARAIGGNGKFEIIYGFLRQVSIGDLKIRNVPVYIREFYSKNEKIDGYIGLALISKFLTTIDYGGSTFTLKKKNILTLEDYNELSLPLRLTSSGFLSGEIQLQGVEAPLNFIVDTGASVSVISDDLAGTKEISPFVKDEKIRVVGAAGVTENVQTFLLPRVSFGRHSRESVKAIALDLDIINEAAGFNQAGILGGNFLKNYRLTFDFENSKVLFVPIK